MINKIVVIINLAKLLVTDFAISIEITIVSIQNNKIYICAFVCLLIFFSLYSNFLYNSFFPSSIK